MKFKNRDSYSVLASFSGVTPSSLKRRVLLCGEAAYSHLGMSNQSPGKNFVVQQPRETTAGFLSQFDKSNSKLNVWVDERVLGFKKVRFAFALDGYLYWGLRERKKGVLVLIGGAESEKHTNLEVMAFVDGRLVSTAEKVLPATNEPAFTDTRDSLLADLRGKYPTGRFVLAAPLSDWQLDTVEYVGDQPLRNLSYRPVVNFSKQHSALIKPAAVVVCGLLAYGTFLSAGWGKYSDAIDNYEKAIRDPAIHNKGGIDTNFLNTMNARRIYMETPRRQAFLVEKAERVIRGVAAIDRVKIIEMRLPAPSVNPQAYMGIAVSPNSETEKLMLGADRAPDVWISLSVPKTENSALRQGKDEVLEGVAQRTGMSVRIAQQGIREDKGRRIYNIEGFFHD